MTIADITASLQDSNPEAATALQAYQTNFDNTLGRVAILEKDIKGAAEKRDSLKTIIRNATGLQDVTEDGLTEFLTSKGGGQADIFKKEIGELQARLSEGANAVDEVSTKYEKEIFGLKLDRAVNMLGVQDEVHSPHAYGVILEELARGAIDEGDTFAYKNDDGTSVFTQDGQPAGLKSRYEEMKADERFSYLFKEQFKAGGGKAPAGPATNDQGVTLKRSTMDDASKAAYIAKNGMPAYKQLPLK
jgi:hypothetical protein